ncbi:MAG: uncharacterized protein QG608_3504, partial [Actinomycetota bacterium]|nr:uncharacterized protein [Actinomycetota bacterium]
MRLGTVTRLIHRNDEYDLDMVCRHDLDKSQITRGRGPGAVHQGPRREQELSRRPVLLIGIGSDLAMMEALNGYGRPFHQRATEMVIPPLNPAEVADMVQLPPAQAIDAYLVSGGLPLVLDEWDHGLGAMEYLDDVVPDATSALLVSGERALAAEFPPESQARAVLGVIGAGERTIEKETSGDGVEPAHLRSFVGSLGGQIMSGLHGQPSAGRADAGLLQTYGQVRTHPSMTVKHPAQGHARNPQTGRGLRDAQVEPCQDVLTEDFAWMYRILHHGSHLLISGSPDSRQVRHRHRRTGTSPANC